MKGFSFLWFQVTKQSRHTQLKDFLPFPFLFQNFKATQTIRSSYTSHITHHTHTHVYAREWTETVETEVKQEKIEFFSLTGFVFLVSPLTNTIHGLLIQREWVWRSSFTREESLSLWFRMCEFCVWDFFFIWVSEKSFSCGLNEEITANEYRAFVMPSSTRGTLSLSLSLWVWDFDCYWFFF